jgi:glycerol-3-phosphate acyltransferase PlsX
MSDSVVISVDAMGGDQGPAVAVPGAALAAQRLGPKVRFLLHGDQVAIESELNRYPAARAVCEVRHAEGVIAMDEKPAQALRRAKGTSLWNAVEAIREGEAAAAVSAGNTGALMAVSKLILRMAGGLDRPAIVASWPTLKGVSAVLDVGANITADAEQLIEFAIMGEAFHCAVLGPGRRPTVGILNVGSEDVKGHEEVREAHRLLREAIEEHGLEIDYRGFVEGDDIAKGTVDVVVTDGFTGNIALKTAEGMARFFTTLAKETLTSSVFALAGAALASGALKKIRHRLDPSNVNGGPLLGLNGVVVKSHGGADAKGFANALKVAADLATSDYAAQIARNRERLDRALASAKVASETPQ